MTLAKGFKYVKPSKELQETVDKAFNIPVVIVRVVENIFTGAEVTLIHAIKKPKWFIRYSSGDIEEFTKWKEAKNYFNEMVSKVGELK